MVFLIELMTDIFASGITPDDSIVIWLSFVIPANDGLSLIGDSHAFDFLYFELWIFMADVLDDLFDGFVDIVDDLLRIVLEPSLLRCVLLMLDYFLAE